MSIKTKLKFLFFKQCFLWKYHVQTTWNFFPFIAPWNICKYCPVGKFNGIGKAFRETIRLNS